MTDDRSSGQGQTTTPWPKLTPTLPTTAFPEPKPSATSSSLASKPSDPVNHPSHYTSHPSGIECIQVTEHMNFCIGNAVKYLWRADLKNGLEDLKKAQWYINREIERRSK